MRSTLRFSFCLFFAFLLQLCSWSAASASGESVTYSYDQHHRLIAAEYSDGLTIEYEYDLTGNLVAIRSQP
jgi:YD repeat-containing protein